MSRVKTEYVSRGGYRKKSIRMKGIPIAEISLKIDWNSEDDSIKDKEEREEMNRGSEEDIEINNGSK